MSKLSTLAFAAGLMAIALPAVAQDGPLEARAPNGHFVMKDGEAIYKNVCAACHMSDAKGAKGAGVYPALAGNPKLAAAAYPIRVVVLGQKGMPPLGPNFDDEQVAAVVGYIRTHFGNSYPAPVTAAEVKAQRPANEGSRRRGAAAAANAG